MRTIDADAMKAEVGNLDAESNNRTYLAAMEDMLEFFVMLIDKQPTIEPQVRRGRWIFAGEETTHDGWAYRKHKCSECGFLTVEAINFCQNCGAYMIEDGGADSND